MNITSLIYMYGIPNTTPHTSNGTTSNTNSSIKYTLVEKLILHFLVTLIFESLFSYPNGYVLEWLWTYIPIILNTLSTTRFDYELKSHKSSSLVFLTWLLIWNIFFIYSLPCDEGYLNSPPFSLMQKRSSYPNMRFYIPSYLNPCPIGYFSLNNSYDSLDSTLYVASKTYLWCDHEYCNGCSSCLDHYTYVQ